jgi:hypothetical protein
LLSERPEGLGHQKLWRMPTPKSLKVPVKAPSSSFTFVTKA